MFLGAQIEQLTELRIVGEWPGVVSAASSRLLPMPQSTMDDTELRADCRHNYRYPKWSIEYNDGGS